MNLEYKVLNDLTPEARLREWQSQQTIMIAMERALIKRMESLLIKQGQISAEAFESDGKPGVELSFKNHPQEVETLLVAHYGVVMQTFGQRIIDGISKEKSEAILESKDQQSFFRRSLIEWVEKNAGAKITKIANTTRENIREAIRLGEVEGLSLSKMKKMIQLTARSKAGYRARRIAITETHSAAVAAGDMAADSTQVELQREWLTALDGRERSSHADLNGQRATMKEPFQGNGFLIMRPGDPRAPAEETINCRCSILYVTPDAPPTVIARPPVTTPPVVRVKPPREKPLGDWRPKPAKPIPVSTVAPSKWKPAKTIDEAEEWLQVNSGGAENIRYTPEARSMDAFRRDRGMRLRRSPWGSHKPLGERAKLNKLNNINQAIDDFQRRFKIKLPRVKNFYVTNISRAKAQMTPDSKNASIAFTGNWTEKTYKNITAWEKRHPGKWWDWLDEGDKSWSRTMRHEYGHIIDGHYKITGDDSFSRMRTMLRTKLEFTGSNISEYANTNQREWWAEAFSQYTSPLYGKERPKFPAALEKLIEDTLDKLRV